RVAVLGRERRIGEVNGPVHAAAERLVLRLAAAAEAVVLERRTAVSRLGLPLRVLERDATGDAIRAVLRHFDRGRPLLVDLPARLAAGDRLAQGAGRARADRAGDVVGAPPARCDEGVALAMEGRWQRIGAEAGVRARASVVEDGDLHAGVALLRVGDAARLLGAAEADPGVAAVAERLQLRGAAAAERHLRQAGELLSEPAPQAARVRDQVRAVGGRANALGEAG